VTRRIETREVLASAYVRRGQRMLTHAVIADSQMGDIAVMCRRVSIYNLAGRSASDPKAAVTCRSCCAAIERARKKGFATADEGRSSDARLTDSEAGKA
jgi:hypothetical protein